MGLSSFNRMRRERAKGAQIEAGRTKEVLDAQNEGRRSRLDIHRENRKKLRELRQEDVAASERIGEKVREGMRTRTPDEPLRRDHAAEIAGRNIQGVQEPKDPVARVSERIPDDTANEKLVGHMGVEMPGPDMEMLKAAAAETGAEEPGTTVGSRAGARASSRRRESDDEDAVVNADGTLKNPGPTHKGAAEEDTRNRNRLSGGDEPLASKQAVQLSAEDDPSTKIEGASTAGADADTTGDDPAADADRARTLATRAKVKLPKTRDKWDALPWNTRRSLAAEISDEPIHTADDADKAYDAEMARRQEG